MLIAAGLLNVVRLGRWRGWATWEEPLVAVLHVGYAWLAVSLLVMGSAVLGAALAKEDAVHALTTGAVGVMTLGIMTRATLGHTGRPRHAGPATVVIYILVNVGALVRTFGPLTDVQPALVLGVAGACWSGAYLLFVAVYGSMLVVPSLDD
jgi:uncharacterized protein involved in response to NO